MKKDEFLSIVRKQIRFVFDRDEIENELKQHLADSIEDLMEEGLSCEEAEYLAVEQMGNPVEVGKLLNKEHNPLLGYLWAASKLLLACLICPAVLHVGITGFFLLKTITPMTLKDSVETYYVGIDMELPTHKVKLDKICLSKSGRYSLTFRAWAKLRYSRAGVSIRLFTLKDEEGNHLGGGTVSSGSFFEYGSKDFEWPENSVLHIVGVDDEVIELDLTEYCDEKR